MKSKAMVVIQPGHMELREYEVVPPPKEHVLIKTSVTSVCSSDIKIFHGTVPLAKYP